MDNLLGMYTVIGCILTLLMWYYPISTIQEGKSMLYVKEGGVLIKLDNWEQVYTRPNYVVDIDSKGKVLNEVFGYYKNEPSRACGLKNCHAGHKKGFIVRTEDGLETCIGHICGTTIFKEKFEVLAQRMESEVNLEIYKETVASKKQKVFEYWQQAAELTSGPNGILKLAEKIEQIKDPLVVGRYAATELSRMASNRDTKVLSPQSVPKDKNEYNNPAEDAPIEYKTVLVVIGQIQQIEILASDNSLRDLYEKEISQVLTALENVDLNAISRRQLTNIGRRASMLDARIARAKELQESAIKFLRKKNLKPLYHQMFPMDNVSRKDLGLYNDFINSLK
ncbi:hypothetical protein [Serratia ureilytica]|uniref:hypothetical protein n=2 Tax=Serratia ureilytica TaxID=300181 RepID=UPI00159CBC95|nr:hypothetical protein [Serratia ureilytica]NVM48315.1 hypothetical protein [Serratia ureilytica]